MNHNDSKKQRNASGTATESQPGGQRQSGSGGHQSPTHQKPPADNDRKAGAERGDRQRQQGGSGNPDMGSHKNAGTSTQEQKVRRSNQAGDDDVNEPTDSSDADVKEPKVDDKRMRTAEGQRGQEKPRA